MVALLWLSEFAAAGDHPVAASAGTGFSGFFCSITLLPRPGFPALPPASHGYVVREDSG